MELINHNRVLTDLSPNKIFETLNVPERKKHHIDRLETGINQLNYNVSLLDIFINKPKIQIKKNQKTKKILPLFNSFGKTRLFGRQLSSKRILTVDSSTRRKMAKNISNDNINEESSSFSKKRKKVNFVTNDIENNELKKQDSSTKIIKGVLKNSKSVLVKKENLPEIKNKKHVDAKLHKYLFDNNPINNGNNLKNNDNSPKIAKQYKSSDKMLPL